MNYPEEDMNDGANPDVVSVIQISDQRSNWMAVEIGQVALSDRSAIGDRRGAARELTGSPAVRRLRRATAKGALTRD